MRQLKIPVPWTSGYGLARTLLALGTLGTLAFSNSATLFRDVATVGHYPLCKGVTGAGAWCLVPSQDYETVRWLCCLVLLLVASGWRPALTAVPHAYIAFSVFTGIAIPDGGDQITWLLSLLIAIVALGDTRRWHWQAQNQEGTVIGPCRRRLALLGTSALVLARLQMSVVYFQACVAKLPHAEWADGTALYYWINNYAFGAAGWLHPLLDAIVRHPVGVALMTWLPLGLELSLAAALLLPQRVRWILLMAGFMFHLGIAVVMGLWSFALAMWAGLLILLAPLGHDPDLLSLLRPRRRATASPSQESTPESEQPVAA
ncbi:HTTM domain-containing protein [Streptomyces sp. LP11]|uniref:HTTM domain-containing protein n=1 Tax=Streptomyces pyxinicus TaxID=2970331 RepID=A0ABT2AZ54_9ACTN|nr:sporulation-delaying protein SdpB family protein [Streptomyces sp. LP11]MCS0601411.1 HTTM domain-containing protein [Streptomyces sp. LP11]